MKKRISSISIHQSSKVIALFYFILTLIVCLPLSIAFFFTVDKMQAFAILIFPFFSLFLNYVIYVIVFWFYNRVADAFGGIEVTVDDMQGSQITES